MKKFLLPVLFCAIAFSAAAQQKTSSASATAIATIPSADEFELDEATFLQVKQAYVAYIEKQKALQKQHAGDNAALADALDQEQVEFDKTMHTLMNRRQYDLYQARSK